MENHYAFIDSQNLNLSILRENWKLDFGRFRIFLKRKYGIQRAFLFMGYIINNESMYRVLEGMGYELIFKPVLQSKAGLFKGNCDAELVLHCMLQYQNFDKAMIISGDGDFYCLIEQLKLDNKLLRVGIPNRRHYSALLRQFRPYFFFISDLRQKLEYKKR